MHNRLKLYALFMIFGLMFGCAAKKGSQSDNADHSRLSPSAFDKEPAAETRHILATARSAIGTPYVRGGTDPGGFDCSGLVRWAYKHAGINLPRSAREQALVGTPVTRIEDMREGDIVAFRHPRRGYHTGIYAGDGKFVHSPRRRRTVRIASLSDPYFNSTFLGARRINLNGDEDLVAEARSRLNEYTKQKAARKPARVGQGKARSGRNTSAKGGKAARAAAKGGTSAKKPVKAAPGKKSVRASAEKSKSSAPPDRAHGKTGQKNSRNKTDKS